MNEERIRRRGTDSEESIQRRLAAAQQELARAGEYDEQVINDNLDVAIAELGAIVQRQWEKAKHAG